MPSKFTENYGLNQWEPGDKVVHTDFNEDNRKIDAALKALDEKKVPHIKAAWYWGKGTDRQFIDVGFHPDGVAVFASDQQGSAAKGIYGGVTGAGAPVEVVVGSQSYIAIQIMDNGFYVHETSTGSADMDIHRNKNGLRYGYIAVGW